MTNAAIIDDITPVRNTARTAVLDPEAPLVETFNSIARYVKNLPLTDRVEMLLTLRSFVASELTGEPPYSMR